MGERLICHKCRNGLYCYSEPEREDWENREMTCDNCGHKDTIHKQTEKFFQEVDKQKEKKPLENCSKKDIENIAERILKRMQDCNATLGDAASITIFKEELDIQ